MIFSPCLNTNHAIGTDGSVIKASPVFPHSNSITAFIFGPVSGSKAPPMLLNTVFAAVALAAYGANSSAIYVVIGMKEVIIPIANVT